MTTALEPVVGRQRPGPAFWSRGTLDGVESIRVGCPGCALVATLQPTHSVDRDGMVSPSLDCPKCPFHDHVKLVGYQELIL